MKTSVLQPPQPVAEPAAIHQPTEAVHECRHPVRVEDWQLTQLRARLADSPKVRQLQATMDRLNYRPSVVAQLQQQADQAGSPRVGAQRAQFSRLSRKPRGKEEGRPIQGRATQATATAPKEKKPTQRKASPDRKKQPAQRKAAPSPNRTGLPDNLKAGVEALSGLSLDHVKVHYDSAHPAQLNALAYAQGSDIHVAPGQERHLPHEAWHVVQQMRGRVKPTVQLNGGVPVNDDAGLEHEADVMGARGLQFAEIPKKLVTQKQVKEKVSQNVQAIQLCKPTIQLGAAASKAASNMGRNAAVINTAGFRKGTLGYLVHSTVKPFAGIFGDLASGSIGKHYLTEKDVLAAPLTRIGIIKFAIKETEWWKKEPGIPGLVGSLMSKHMRAWMLIQNAKYLGLLPADQEEKTK